MEKGQIVIKSDSFKLLPQSLSEMYKLAFSLMFSSGPAYEPVSAMLSVCLASLRPLSLSSLHAVLNSVCLEPELSRAEVVTTLGLISSQVVTRGDGSLMVSHPTLRDWLLRGGRGAGHRFGVNVRAGHLAIALHQVRSVQLLVLCHLSRIVSSDHRLSTVPSRFWTFRTTFSSLACVSIIPRAPRPPPT